MKEPSEPYYTSVTVVVFFFFRFWPKKNTPCPDIHSPSMNPEVLRDMPFSPKSKGRKKERKLCASTKENTSIPQLGVDK